MSALTITTTASASNAENIQQLMPPLPPTGNSITQSDDDFVPGDFSYLENSMRSFVEDAYLVITRNEWWNEFRKTLISEGVDEQRGFMLSRNPFYNKIMDAISQTDIGGLHSGASIGCTMRNMEIIALYGEREYKRRTIQTIREQEELRLKLLEERQQDEAAVQSGKMTFEVRLERERLRLRNRTTVQEYLRNLMRNLGM